MFLFNRNSTQNVLPSSMKEFPNHLKASAVIEISNQGESCRDAVKTVLSNTKFFCDVHFVYFAGNENTVYYPGFLEDFCALQEAGLHVHRHARLNLQKLETLMRIDIAPDLDATEGAFYVLFDCFAADPSVNEAGVSSQLYLEASERRRPSDIMEAMLFYGFLLVLLVFDTLRSIVRLFRYNRTVDLKGVRLSRVYPHQTRAPPDRWYMWWIFTGVAATQRGASSCIQTPPDSGLALLMRTIRSHRYLTWVGLWWLGFWLYYACFAWPWWNYVLDPHSMLGAWLVRDMSRTFWQLVYVAHTFFAGCITWAYVDEYPYHLKGLHVLTYTLYLTFFPIAWFVCKVYQIKTGDKRRRKKQMSNKNIHE